MRDRIIEARQQYCDCGGPTCSDCEPLQKKLISIGADAFIPMVVELQQALWLVASYRGNTIFGYTPDEDLAIEDALSRTADVADEALANLEKFLGDKNE